MIEANISYDKIVGVTVHSFWIVDSKVQYPTSYLHHRLLETDSKSLRSMNGSRRNSGSSLVSSSSASSNLSHLEEDSWILWGRIVNEWEEVRKKKEKQLKVRPVHMTSCDMTAKSHADLLKSLLKHDCIKSLLRYIWPGCWRRG